MNLLRRFQSDRGKIRARRVTGNCTQHHREVAIAIKTARELALLPYTQRTVSDKAGRDGRGGRGGPRGPRPDAARDADVDAGSGDGIDADAEVDVEAGADEDAVPAFSE